MSESDIYRAGYAKAITDVCRLFDEVHDNYVKAFQCEYTTEEELKGFESRLVTINTVICDLTSRLQGVI